MEENTHWPLQLLKFDEPTLVEGNKEEEKESTKGEKKRSRDRYDSVYRSILRRFRKFYNLEFDKTTRYKALKRYRESIFYMDWISEYTSMNFPTEKHDDLIFYLANLVYPNQLITHKVEFQRAYPKLKKFMDFLKKSNLQISDILFNFTFSKMEQLLENPSYSILFENFASKIHNQLKDSEAWALERMLTLWR